ncbi:M28 family peptidase [Winogradskyella alexanderae]|uniref:M28 family peptidase n=1 Tax=Winogradskyella alexanderae TaxID=2877123 RepID=A0ABS7XRE3_9FLAO|nr:M28 family peptidase [Winogradskyella alexanderae]MCA0132583.1 M28 family peptidase [Winogradskyella alexanderae]
MNIKFISVIVLLVVFNIGFSQSIQDLMNEVNTSNLETTVNQLSGEEPAIINGTTQTISNRVHSNNDLSATYIQERLEAFPNLTVEVQNFNTTGKNVIATQLGSTNPDDIYIICAHYDSVTTFCADDNATGVAAVIEIARILSRQCTDNTIVYALWDEEEIGLLGANFYAQQAADETGGNTRDNILGVVNMDMIGYDGDAPGTAGDNDFDIDVRNIANSLMIKDDLLDILNTYTFDLNPIVVDPGTTFSDHSTFWNQGYSAVLVGESWETNDQTPNYHTSNDRAADIDFPYMTELTKLVLAYTATKASLAALDNTVTENPTDLVSNEATGPYQWYNCDTGTPINGATSQSFTPISDGNYAVEVSNGSCSEISNCIAFTALSTEKFTSKEISIYPNPVHSILKVENFYNQDLYITINDISGKVVSVIESNESLIELNLSRNSNGVYFVNVSSDKKASSYKIVKE